MHGTEKITSVVIGGLTSKRPGGFRCLALRLRTCLIDLAFVFLGLVDDVLCGLSRFAKILVVNVDGILRGLSCITCILERCLFCGPGCGTSRLVPIDYRNVTVDIHDDVAVPGVRLQIASPIIDLKGAVSLRAAIFPRDGAAIIALLIKSVYPNTLEGVLTSYIL